jgi:hypothetical protein
MADSGNATQPLTIGKARPLDPHNRAPRLPDLLWDGSVLRSCRHSQGRRKGSRSRSETDIERRALRGKTQGELDAIVAEFHALLPRAQADAIGAAYARFSTRFQDSIADQLSGILQDAVKRRIFVPRENIFFDLAVRGQRASACTRLSMARQDLHSRYPIRPRRVE